MRVLILTSHFPPAYLAGGPVRTLEAAIRRSESPSQYWVMTSDSDLGELGTLAVHTDDWVTWHGCRVWYQRHHSIWSLAKALVAEVRVRPDVIYLNSLWGLRYATLHLLLRRMRLVRAVIVLAPRGQLSISALAIKPRKKQTTLSLFKWMRLTRGVVIQASSEREADDARRVLGEQTRIIVSSNETLSEATDPSAVAIPGPVLRVVYLGRISPIKGVHLLLSALADLGPSVRLDLDLYGDAVDATYFNECRAVASRIDARLCVTFHGPVAHEDVATRFAGADLFVLPTASENFGHVIAEAMANACPVAVPDTTPWSKVVRDGGGWMLPDRQIGSISSLLRHVANMTVEERHQAKRDAAGAYTRWYDSGHSGGLDHLMSGLLAEDSREGETSSRPR